MQGRCRASRFRAAAEAERRSPSARCGALTIDEDLSFSEDRQGVHRRMAN